MEQSFTLPVIAHIKSPYGQKFAVPRQSGLAPDALSVIRFVPPYSDPRAFLGLEGFSHLYLLFIFDKVPAESSFRPQVRPPRLGGNQYVGVFASRSPFRPARLGLSVVRLERIEQQAGEVSLVVAGADLVDGTPIVDIKPYIPFTDSVPEAKGGFATQPPALKQVEFTQQALLDLKDLTEREQRALVQILAQDPRPAYKTQERDDKVYFALLLGYNIGFKAENQRIVVVEAHKHAL